jgi:hypothetical protein
VENQRWIPFAGRDLHHKVEVSDTGHAGHATDSTHLQKLTQLFLPLLYFPDFIWATPLPDASYLKGNSSPNRANQPKHAAAN